MLKFFREIFFGRRTAGEQIQQPKIKTLYPTQTIDEAQWMQEVKFGSRYGTRGSFYQY